jgi:glucose dehydrogenase/cytochrome c553
VRPGDNLFTVSVLALDIKTGEYRWHYQMVHHDIWDYDASNPVILFDLDYAGVPRKGLVQAGKTGFLYILDRVTGVPLVGIEERPVPQEPRNATAATQPYPIGDSFVPHEVRMEPEGYKLVNQGRIFTPFWTEPVVVSPGLAGGANWPPSAVDPTRGHMYICGNDRPFAYKAEEIGTERPEPGANFTGGGFLGYPLWNLGVFAAMDLRTNKVVWQKHWKEPCNSGVTATAGGLLFVGRNDGRLTALDSDNGEVLWQFQTGAGMNAPVTVFEHKGEQYVLAYSAGNTLGPSPHGDGVWLFSLNGTQGEALPPGAGQVQRSVTTPAEGPADLAAGEVVYNSMCAACHGEEGRGGHGGGISLANVDSTELVISIVNQGRNRMPALSAALSPEQLRDVSAYVASELSE